MKMRSLKISRARQLRKNATYAEAALWQELRSRQFCGYRFKRQHPMGNFIVDFVCLESRLVVELDGGQDLESLEYDETRTGYLDELGYTVIRFWNNQVLNDLEGVKEAILLALNAR